MNERPAPVFQKPAENYEPRGRLDPAGFARNVTFRDPKPPADLAPFVEHFWVIRWQDMDEAYPSTEVMHRPYVDAFFSADEAGIQGTFRNTRTYTATAGSGRLLGIRFRPGAFHLFWPGEMATLQDQVMPLTTAFAWGTAATVAAILALDDDAALAALAGHLRTTLPAPDPIIDELNAIIHAVEADEELSTVAAVATSSGRSERWLQQTFRDYLGINLKWLLQRRRLLAAARRIRETETPDWADIAYALGYASQQHFITDFKTVLGATPVQYKNSVTDA